MADAQYEPWTVGSIRRHGYINLTFPTADGDKTVQSMTYVGDMSNAPPKLGQVTSAALNGAGISQLLVRSMCGQELEDGTCSTHGALEAKHCIPGSKFTVWSGLSESV